MKNIILQHWTGDMNELGTLSSANISKYATKVGADYRLLRGNVFNPKLCAPMQKLFTLERKPTLTDPNYPYWGGAIYKLNGLKRI